MKIRVTARDIEKGAQGDCGLCPIARATQRAFDTEKVYVCANAVLVGSNWDYWDLPKRAINFIKRFDAGRSVTPFEFEIEVEP